jgi:long-chain acyl-CoA synthetase
VAQHVVAAIRERIAGSGNRLAMAWKAGGTWQTLTYAEVGGRVEALASWLIQSGLQRGDRAILFAQNSPQWSIADLAIMTAGGIPVPIYATDPPNQASHVVRDSGARVAFVGGSEQYDTLAGVRGPSGPIERTIVFDSSVTLDGPGSYHLDTLPRGVDPGAVEARLGETTVDDVATIIYTSGTTGDRKGAVLTHRNLWSQFEAVDAHFSVTETDRSLCILPLSHAYERAWTFYILYKGAANYYLDDPKKAVEAMHEVRPTCMVSVPRLYEKIYATARHQLSRAPALKRAIAGWAMGIGREVGYARARGEHVGPAQALQYALADRLVLGKIREVFGGPKSVLSAGGARLAPEIEEFFFSAGLLVCQGYGLTETSPMVSCNRPGDFRFGTVGKPIAGCEVRVAADGEILVRGANVTRGYFGREQATHEAFEGDWFRTGDIGEVDADGFLRITDRKKDLIITSGGKNIAPALVESVIGKDYYIDQIAAVGEGRHYLAALVVPQFEALEAWARERGLTYESLRALVRDARVVAFIAERIEQQQTVLARHERVKRFVLLSERFTQGGGEITPTLKNVRATIAAKYGAVINAMYSSEWAGGGVEPAG